MFLSVITASSRRLRYLEGPRRLGGAAGFAKELEQVELPLHGHLPTDYKSEYYPSAVTDNMLCAGLLGGWKGGCYGDSGELW